MKSSQKAALILMLAGKLRENGNWCGETHFQKAIYFLQDLLSVPFEFDFVLYRHGPYSFELHDELNSMHSDGLFKMTILPPYGPQLSTTELGATLQNGFPITISRYKKKIDFIADKFGIKGVNDLEKLSTAFFINQKSSNDADVVSRASEINKLKSHISVIEAKLAIEEVDNIIREAKKIHLVV